MSRSSTIKSIFATKGERILDEKTTERKPRRRKTLSVWARINAKSRYDSAVGVVSPTDDFVETKSERTRQRPKSEAIGLYDHASRLDTKEQLSDESDSEDAVKAKRRSSLIRAKLAVKQFLGVGNERVRNREAHQSISKSSSLIQSYFQGFGQRELLILWDPQIPSRPKVSLIGLRRHYRTPLQTGYWCVDITQFGLLLSMVQLRTWWPS